MSELKLLNCPFCGGKAEIGNPYTKTFLIWCRNCQIGTTNCPSRKRAFELWNRRTPMANIVEKLEELKEETGCEGVDCGECKYTKHCWSGEMSYMVTADKAINIVNQEINKEI